MPGRLMIAARHRASLEERELLRADEDPARHLRLFQRCADLMLAIGDSPKPVIAKVTGAAVAAGCQLVASCDLAYADRGARFAVSGIDQRHLV